MRGYLCGEGYWGYLNGKYHLFATEEDYIEIYLEATEKYEDESDAAY